MNNGKLVDWVVGAVGFVGGMGFMSHIYAPSYLFTSNENDTLGLVYIGSALLIGAGCGVISYQFRNLIKERREKENLKN